MIKKALIIAFIIALLTSSVALACPAPCSPGYWKNHTDVWWAFYPEATAQAMLAGLQGGYATRESRVLITEELNATIYWAPCE